MSDLIERDKAKMAVRLGVLSAATIYGRTDEGMTARKEIERAIDELPSAAQPDFSCKGCQTPKHICGICMRNYPNITDHYTGGEAG